MDKAAGLRARLDAAFGQHPNVDDIHGRGLFVGIELVADRQTKAAFDPALRIAEKIQTHAMQAGLICYPAQGTIDGRHGDHILLAPPHIISEDENDMLVILL